MIRTRYHPLGEKTRMCFMVMQHSKKVSHLVDVHVNVKIPVGSHQQLVNGMEWY
jgi:hypothetical protein